MHFDNNHQIGFPIGHIIKKTTSLVYSFIQTKWLNFDYTYTAFETTAILQILSYSKSALVEDRAAPRDLKKSDTSPIHNVKKTWQHKYKYGSIILKPSIIKIIGTFLAIRTCSHIIRSIFLCIHHNPYY